MRRIKRAGFVSALLYVAVGLGYKMAYVRDIDCKCGMSATFSTNDIDIYFPDIVPTDVVKFPLLSFSHGLNKGGPRILSRYKEMLETLVGAGYVIIAHQSGGGIPPAWNYFDGHDQLRAMTWLRDHGSDYGNKKVRAVWNMIDWVGIGNKTVKTGIFGTSTGGTSTLNAAGHRWKNAISELNIGGAYAIMPYIRHADINNAITQALSDGLTNRVLRPRNILRMFDLGKRTSPRKEIEDVSSTLYRRKLHNPALYSSPVIPVFYDAAEDDIYSGPGFRLDFHDRYAIKNAYNYLTKDNPANVPHWYAERKGATHKSSGIDDALGDCCGSSDHGESSSLGLLLWFFGCFVKQDPQQCLIAKCFCNSAADWFGLPDGSTLQYRACLSQTETEGMDVWFATEGVRGKCTHLPNWQKVLPEESSSAGEESSCSEDLCGCSKEGHAQGGRRMLYADGDDVRDPFIKP